MTTSNEPPCRWLLRFVASILGKARKRERAVSAEDARGLCLRRARTRPGVASLSDCNRGKRSHRMCGRLVRVAVLGVQIS